MAVIDDFMAFNKMENVLDEQREHLETIVRGIRPLTIVDERKALLELLQTFESDGGARASTVAAFAVIALAKARTRIVALEAPWPSEAQQIALVAFVMGEHVYAVDHCYPQPGTDCESWCKACKVLAGLPSDVIDAAKAKVVGDELRAYGS